MNLDVIICGAFVNGKPIGLIKDLLKALSNYSFNVHLVKEREFREKTLNEGMKSIGKRDLLILGDDITLTDGWLQSLNKYKAKGDIIGFSMLYPNTKKIENTGYDIVQVDERITLIARNRGKDIRDIKEFNYTSCDAISGCAMFIKKEVLKELNRFSLDGQNRWGEFIFTQQAKKIGFKVIVLGHFLYHEGAFFADVNIFPVAHFIPDNRWKKYRGKLYYGPEYVILRREFRKDYPPLDNKTPNILITMGGSDRENLTRKILQATLSIPDVRITVILGRFFTYYSEIRQMAARKGNIDVYRDVQNIAEFMLRADLAITYFGVTAYELAKMGVPAIVIAHSERDKINAERFSKYGTCISLGYFKEVNEKKIYSATRRLLGDKKLREKMSKNGKKLLDGKGSERVARIIVDIDKRLQ